MATTHRKNITCWKTRKQLNKAIAMQIFRVNDQPKLPFRRAVKKPIPINCIQMTEDFEVETLEGVLRGRAGDYLMVGVNGELYPCAKDIFEKTYDWVD